MKKSIVLLLVLLIGAVTFASFFAVEWQHERKRADALALRAFEHEPVEKGTAAMRQEPQLLMSKVEAASATIAEPPVEMPPEPKAQLPKRKSVMDYPGTLRTREQVNRLQSRLAKGTPLEDYQIRALIDALDELYLEQASTRHAGDAPDVDNDRLRERMIRVSSDILFESQLEVFMEMVREGDGGG